MEKNATETKNVVKAEPLPAATEVITVDLDPEALNCPRCHRPLAPPVFQCAAGHVVCSTCHGDLPYKDRCVSCFVKTGYTHCFIPTSYSRCLALERVLRSARVACSHGCSAAKMMYHEKAEHAKSCLGYDGIPVTHVMGPCGGLGGNARNMASDVGRVVAAVVRHCNAVDSITFMCQKDGKEDWIGTWGGQGGKPSQFRLQPDEYFTSVHGYYGSFKGMVVVRSRSLTFVTNRGTYGPYGKKDGVRFVMTAGAGSKIIRFHARSGQWRSQDTKAV